MKLIKIYTGVIGTNIDKIMNVVLSMCITGSLSSWFQSLHRRVYKLWIQGLLTAFYCCMIRKVLSTSGVPDNINLPQKKQNWDNLAVL